ncbi:MAG: hypothetical protein GY795_33435 [Desulfobacterales bacterium]|nr:hypothetical protein [Desulfobacterales bacterium]
MELTDWHHLMGMALNDFFSGTSYEVRVEEDISKKKQILDVLIVRRGDGNQPDELPDGFEELAAHNLLSYKSMHEPFDDWAGDELLGHFVDYRKQVSPSLKKLLPKTDFRLYAVSTRYPKKLAEQVRFEPVKEGVYDILWGVRKIRFIVTSRIPKEKRNALWLMFSAVQEKVRYGVSNYEGKMDEMGSTINQLLIKYRAGGINMPYTVEDYRKEVKRNVLNSMTPDEILSELLKKASSEKILENFPLDELLKVKGFSPDEIEAVLKKSKKKNKKS